MTVGTSLNYWQTAARLGNTQGDKSEFCGTAFKSSKSTGLKSRWAAERSFSTMSDVIENTVGDRLSPFERIKRTNAAGMEFWSSREFAGVLGYGDYRNFAGVVEKAKLACFNSGHRIEDHFVDVTEMVAIGSGAERPVKTILLSRYACYLAVQNADPKKAIVAHGQTYFATQTRRQELEDGRIEDERRVLLRQEMRRHNVQLADAAKDAGVVEPSTTPFFRITATWGFMAG
jgi:DNA-damage-inducible protein D